MLEYAIPATLGGSLPVFMPVSWMAATHRWLGLGEMPTGPIVEYLDTFQADHDSSLHRAPARDLELADVAFL